MFVCFFFTQKQEYFTPSVLNRLGKKLSDSGKDFMRKKIFHLKNLKSSEADAVVTQNPYPQRRKDI